MEKKYRFIIPDFLNEEECAYFLGAFSLYKEIFKENIDIVGVCGEFPGCCFGTCEKKFDRYQLNREYLKKLKEKYNSKFNKSIYIRMQNNNISKKDLIDEYANMILTIFNDKKNYVICKSEILADYIRRNYLKLNVIFEQECISNMNFENVFISSNYTDKIPQNLLNKNVIMELNEYNIPNRKNKFKHVKKESVLFRIFPRKQNYYNKKGIILSPRCKRIIKEEAIKYENEGPITFMLSGSGVYNYAMIENIIEYLYKEEYKSDARKNIYPLLISLKIKEEIEIYNYRL